MSDGNYKPGGNPDDLLDLKQVEAAVLGKLDEFKVVVEKIDGEVAESGKVQNETKAELEKTVADYNALHDRVVEIEQKGLHNSTRDDAPIDIGKQFIESDQFKALAEGRNGRARMEYKTAIVNATGASQPLVAADRLGGFNTTPNRNLRIRDILPSSGTDSNLVEFVRENTFTNSAAVVTSGSPIAAAENVTKPESGITFTLVSEAVQTIAHWIPASKQVIEDSQQLQAFISGRLQYGLKLYEEAQLLTGTGANGQLNGIDTQATAYTLQSPQITNEIDIIREMIKQAHVAEYFPDAIILNPQDWYDIDVRKVGTSDDRYVVGNPRDMSAPQLWGLPVVVSNSMTSGTCLVGSFGLGAEIKDRNQATVEVSRENSTNFVDNMITILAEERIALLVYRTEAFITATV